MRMPPCFAVVLARHPPVQSMQGRCYGRLDVPLQQGWKTETNLLLTRMIRTGCEAVHTSPAQRCRHVADYVACRAGVPVMIDARLQELNFGAWEGRLWDDVPRSLLDEWAQSPEDFAPPGGEAGGALEARLRAYWRERQQQARPVCIMAHGGPLRVLTALARGHKPDLLAPSMPLGSSLIIQAPTSI